MHRQALARGARTESSAFAACSADTRTPCEDANEPATSDKEATSTAWEGFELERLAAEQLANVPPSRAHPSFDGSSDPLLCKRAALEACVKNGQLWYRHNESIGKWAGDPDRLFGTLQTLYQVLLVHRVADTCVQLNGADSHFAAAWGRPSCTTGAGAAVPLPSDPADVRSSTQWSPDPDDPGGEGPLDDYSSDEFDPPDDPFDLGDLGGALG